MVKKNQQLLLLNDVILRQFLNGCLTNFHPIKTSAYKLQGCQWKVSISKNILSTGFVFLFLCFAVPAVLIKLSYFERGKYSNLIAVDIEEFKHMLTGFFI